MIAYARGCLFSRDRRNFAHSPHPPRQLSRRTRALLNVRGRQDVYTGEDGKVAIADDGRDTDLITLFVMPPPYVQVLRLVREQQRKKTYIERTR